MIYTRATLAPADMCEGGAEKIRRTLQEHGYGPDDMFPMNVMLDSMGLTDTTFALGHVDKSCQRRAIITLQKYMGYMFNFALEHSGIDADRFAVELKATRKRTEGHVRPTPLRHAHTVFCALRRGQADPEAIYGLSALASLACSQRDCIAATHAGIALMDAGRVSGKPTQMQLYTYMKELLV